MNEELNVLAEVRGLVDEQIAALKGDFDAKKTLDFQTRAKKIKELISKVSNDTSDQDAPLDPITR